MKMNNISSLFKEKNETNALIRGNNDIWRRFNPQSARRGRGGAIGQSGIYSIYFSGTECWIDLKQAVNESFSVV